MDNEQNHSFELCDEGYVEAFVGIMIGKYGSKKLTLNQTGLITKVLKEANIKTVIHQKLLVLLLHWEKTKKVNRSLRNVTMQL